MSKDILTRLDEYIEFAEARKSFHDLAFYHDVKNALVSKDKQLKELASVVLGYHRTVNNIYERIDGKLEKIEFKESYFLLGGVNLSQQLTEGK